MEKVSTSQTARGEYLKERMSRKGGPKLTNCYWQLLLIISFEGQIHMWQCILRAFFSSSRSFSELRYLSRPSGNEDREGEKVASCQWQLSPGCWKMNDMKTRLISIVSKPVKLLFGCCFCFCCCCRFYCCCN